MVLPVHVASSAPMLVRAAARRHAGSVVLRHAEREVTYRELASHADAVTRALRAAQAPAGVPVAVCAERSPELVAGVLGVSWAGVPYLPLDPAHPGERRRAMQRDARSPILLTTSALAADAPDGVRVLLLDDLDCTDGPLPPPDSEPDELAYIVYTSGSTGTPKGVEITHRGLRNLVDWHLHAFGMTAGDRATLLAGVGFDASAWELWPALVAGATLVIPSEKVRTSPEGLRDWLVDERVTVSFVPTVLAEQLLRLRWPAETALRFLLTGGERLRRRPPPGLPFGLVNNYGPSECTVVATSGVVEPGTPADPPPSIGRPIDGVQAHVLDEWLRPVTPGIPGELCLGGVGLARGYLGRPDLTAERFVPNPLDPLAGPVYRTGDLVHEAPDGSFEFVGRADDQVKVRGHRIEPAEIEALLARHPAVSAAVTVARRDACGDTNLVAYCVPSEGQLDVAEVRAHLRAHLPASMIPQAITVLDVLPLTPNGKVDKTALPEPRAAAVEPGEPPRTDVEYAVLAIWREILGQDEIGVHDDFGDLGGHSLTAVQVAGRLASRFGLDVDVRTFLDGMTVAGLAEMVERSGVGAAPAVHRGPASGTGPAPLTAAQRRLWFLDKVLPDPALYTNALVFDLVGTVDTAALARSLTELVARHEPLRTRIVEGPEGPRQVAAPPAPVDLPIADLRALPQPERAEVGRGLLRDEAAKPFELGAGQLLRALLVRLDDRTWQLLLTVHHIAFDGWSIDVVLRELGAVYLALAAGGPVTLAALPARYADAAAWEREQLREPALDRLVAYWRGQLAGDLVSLELPTDHPRPATPTFTGHTISRPLPRQLADAMETLARSERGTFFTAAFAGLAALLHRYTGQTDLVVGTPVANRSRPEFEPLIGCFVNTLPLRCDLTGAPSFRELLRRVREVALDGFAHQALPFERILDAAGIVRGRGTHPLVQVMLVVQQPAPDAVRLNDLELRFAEELHTDTARFDLTFVLEPVRGEQVLSLEYDNQLFQPETAGQLLDHLRTLLAAAVADPDQPLDELPLMPAEERRELLSLGRGEVVEIPDTTAHALVEAQARRTPDAPALSSLGHELTYRELNERANALAWRLRELGVGPEVPVAVCLERSVTPVVGMLAVVKAGGIYVPLDPAYPDERLRKVLADTAPPAVLTSAALAGRCQRLHPAGIPLVIEPDGTTRGRGRLDDPTPIAGARNGAYAIHTSGSTGHPKGVLLEHRGLVNLVLAKIERFDVRSDSRVLQFVSFGFGVSVADVFMTLAAGATLVVRGPQVVAGSDLARLVRDERITNLVLPASVLASVPEAELPALRSIAVGGEPCPADLVARWAPGRRFVQAYGPTEATVCSTTAVCQPGEGKPPVGRPIPNVDVFVLDGRWQPAPVGVPGELYVGGIGLARGYLNAPDLTAEVFLPRPDAPGFGGGPGSRLYRTGDVARFRRDGSVELLGRRDGQVQLRGMRVEVGEIEAALRQHNGLGEAAVAVHDHPVAGQHLVGYITSPAALTDDELREFLRERLPDALVPGAFVRLAALPRTGSGKLDRRALPAPELPQRAAERRRPRTVTEELLAEIWAELLVPDGAAAPPPFGIDDDFFALGGQSILAAQAMARTRERFEVELPARVLFEAPTIAALALRVEQAILDDLMRADQPAGETVTAAGRPDPQEQTWT